MIIIKQLHAQSFPHFETRLTSLIACSLTLMLIKVLRGMSRQLIISPESEVIQNPIQNSNCVGPV